MAVDDVPRRALASRLMPLLDLTSLGEDDTPERIQALCAAALAAPLPPAAVCLYPVHVGLARRLLAGSTIKVATVANFPDGGSDRAHVVREIRRALSDGAEEIDLVLPHAALRRGETAMAKALVEAARKACGDAVLKLITETGELRTARLIRQACVIGLAAGVDFLKTSTGKVRVNATLDAASIMLDAIATAGGRCGFKAAGGIRTIADAAPYLALAETRMGTGWIAPGHFRIGASALLADLTAILQDPA